MRMSHVARQWQSNPRIPSLSLIVVALLGGLGCPEAEVPPPTSPPQISVSVARTDMVGSEVPFTVHISGCESVSQLEIYDRQTFLKTVPATLPTTTATLLANELDYTKGLALPIALNAKVTCGDGRTATSRTQALTFLPVAEVLTLPGDEQFVTDLFTAEGSGQNATFLGCYVNEAGYTAIARVNLRGEVVKTSASLPFTCTYETVFSKRHPVSGKRWVWDPAGAVAVDDNLVFSGRYATEIDHLLVAPNGDAIIVADPGSLPLRVRRQSHVAPGAPTWAVEMIAGLIGRPALASGAVFVPAFAYDGAQSAATLHVSVVRVDLASGAIAGSHVVLTDATDTLPFTQWTGFNVTVSDDGAQVYVPRLIDETHATVRACPVATDGCVSAVWESSVLDEWPTLLLPYANGSRVVAVSPRRATFFDATSQGAVFGPSLFPQGASQFFTQAVPSDGEAFFLLSASLNAGGTFNLPAEIIALDSAQRGELFRYQAPAGSVAMSFDDSGHPWMRIGHTLVKPYPLADYRAALASGEAPGGP